MSSNVSLSTPRDGENSLRRPSTYRFLMGGLVFSAVWSIFAGARDPASWIIGLPAVVAAAWCYASLAQDRRHRLSLLALAQFIPLFFWESFKGGIDVARRVLGPRLHVAPGLLDYRLGLTLPSARVFFVDLVSLLPGTLSADVQGDRLRVHALDRSVNPAGDLRRLERLVAAIFGDDGAMPRS